jgi:hypothetical protein
MPFPFIALLAAVSADEIVVRPSLTYWIGSNVDTSLVWEWLSGIV